MKKLIKENKSIFVRLVIIISLIVFLIVLGIFQSNPLICEWWTRNISRFFQTTAGFIFKYIPFSITELFVLSLIGVTIWLIVWTIISLVKKRKKFALSRAIDITLIYVAFIFSYVSTTSLAYYRAELPIPLYEEKVEKSEFVPIISYFLDDYNYCSSTLSYNEDGSLIMPYSASKLSRIIEEEYKKVNDSYFSSFTTYMKPLATSFLFREFHITGVYFGPFGESNYDYLMTTAEYPFTFAHEIAHSKGVMRENDAQLMAAYICLNSEDPYLRYSGYIYTFTSLLNLARYTGNKDDYKNLVNQLDEDIIKNLNQINKYWASHDLLNEIAEFFNNLYLKIFGNDSTGGYDDTPIIINPGTNEITSFSRYQKLYFNIYYN